MTSVRFDLALTSAVYSPPSAPMPGRQSAMTSTPAPTRRSGPPTITMRAARPFERGELAIEDAPVTDDQRALVVAAQAPGLPAGQDVRVPEHVDGRLESFNLSEFQRMRDGGIGRVLVGGTAPGHHRSAADAAGVL